MGVTNQWRRYEKALVTVARSSQAMEAARVALDQALKARGFSTYGTLVLKEGKGLRFPLDKVRRERFFNSERVSGFWEKPTVEQLYFRGTHQAVVSYHPKLSLRHTLKMYWRRSQLYGQQVMQVSLYYPVGWRIRLSVAAPRREAKGLLKSLRTLLTSQTSSHPAAAETM